MTKISVRAGAVMAFLLVAMMVTAAPAFADLDAGAGSIRVPIEDSIGDHDGDADSDEDTSYTEDNDTNDGTDNNVSDDGDNAHPSGKDRSVENGGSGNQGSSESNPDDSKGPQRYEGAKGDDKPNGPGGTDKADQDGNNGCGNDDDFDDDNNGWCGKQSGSTGNSCSEQGGGWECAGGSGGSDDDTEGSTETTGCPNDKMGGDDTGHGANQGTVYDSTCDGSPSGNGNGGGDANGKPCAGCVGNADDKNPPGQMPGGSDDNKGYECDENSGVGQTNPAHTGCEAPEEDEEPEVGNNVVVRTDKACPAGTDNAGLPMNEGDCNEDNSVLGKVLQKAGPLGTAVKKASAALGAVLPFTGNGDVMAFLALATALIAAGLFMVFKKKKVTA